MNDGELIFCSIPDLRCISEKDIKDKLKSNGYVLLITTLMGIWRTYKNKLHQALHTNEQSQLYDIFNLADLKLLQKKIENDKNLQCFLSLNITETTSDLDDMLPRLRKISNNIKAILTSIDFYFHAFGHSDEQSPFPFSYYIVLPNTKPFNSWLLKSFQNRVGEKSNKLIKDSHLICNECEEFWQLIVLKTLDDIAQTEYKKGNITTPRRYFLFEKLGKFLPFLKVGEPPWIYSEPKKLSSLSNLDRWEKILLFEGFLALNPNDAQGAFKTLYIPHPFFAWKVASELKKPIKCKHAERYQDFCDHYDLAIYEENISQEAKDGQTK